MKKVEVFKSDDGRLFEERVDCARADYDTGLKRFRAALKTFNIGADNSTAPRQITRQALSVLEARLRDFKSCLRDLDYHDEDPTDPDRIAAKLAEERRVTINLALELRHFFRSKEEEAA